MQILGQGWESPVVENSVLGNYNTPIKQGSKIEYKWDHPAGEGDKVLWGNVEFVSYLLSNF